MLIPKGKKYGRIKPRRYENAKHLNYVREQPCLFPMYECSGGIEAHHLLRPWSGGRGTGRKANDRNVVPLCAKHHRALHDHGNEDSFFASMSGSPKAGRNEARKLWYSSPFYEDVT